MDTRSLFSCQRSTLELRGTSCLPRIEMLGGDERNRTADPLRAKQVLSHLSYIPTFFAGGEKFLVGLPGIEPGTSRLSSVRSSQLS
jgi:hypothetical protein